MFHVKQLLNLPTILTWRAGVKQYLYNLRNFKIHEILFHVFLFLIPIQLRILYNPESAYIDWYFNYHQAMFFYLSDIVLLTCFIAWFIFDFPKELLKSRIFRLILGFFALLALSLLHVKQISALQWYETWKWVELFILIVYVEQTFKTRVQFLIPFTMLFIGAVCQSILAIAQFHVQHGFGLSFIGEYIAPLGTSGLATLNFGTEKVIRAYGTMPHPNVLGAFLVLGLIIGLYLLSRTKTSVSRVIVSCGTILITLGIFVSFSRMAWSAAAITFLAYLIYMFHAKQYKQFWLTLAIGIVSCGTILILWSKYLLVRTTDIDPTSISSRGLFNNMTVELIKNHLVLGTGAGNYIETLKSIFHVQPWQYQPAHNIFLVITAQFGVLGLGLFLKLLYELSVKLINVSRRETITMVCVFAGVIFLLMGQADHYFFTIQQGRLIFFTILGLIAALPNLGHETSD